MMDRYVKGGGGGLGGVVQFLLDDFFSYTFSMYVYMKEFAEGEEFSHSLHNNLVFGE